MSDIHDTPWIQIERLISRINTSLDAVVISGDISLYLNTASELLKNIYDFLGIPIIFVPGNWDDEGLLDYWNGVIVSIHRKIYNFHHCKFAGIGGSPVIPLGLPLEFEEIELLKFGKEIKEMLRGSRLDILVVHAPPYGILDKTENGKHAGSKAILEIIRELKPRLVLCGHIHEAYGIKTFQGSTIVNSGSILEKRFATIDMNEYGLAVRLYEDTKLLIEKNINLQTKN